MEQNYRVNISIEHYEGPCRESTNAFTFEEAEIVASILARKRDKLSLVMLSIPKEYKTDLSKPYELTKE